MRKKEATVKGLLPIFTEVGSLEKRRIALFFITILSLLFYLVIGVEIYYAPDPSMSKGLALGCLTLVWLVQGYGSINPSLFIPIGIVFSIIGYTLFGTLLWLVIPVLCTLFIVLKKKEYGDGKKT